MNARMLARYRKRKRTDKRRARAWLRLVAWIGLSRYFVAGA